ncbi:hypothetical protein MED01_002438 [Micromonospora sp. MED01]|uniref:hypothetical protein n=1 Tax=Micromonospora alfalfae TaxID=2911212 RepID=UPI001EE8E64D|nr:hypothetical protein [Micromonospora alfalfae]MCG5464272.1 hypothetical protein [Micromonospora alfalfae]
MNNSDNALTALRDSLNRQRTLDQLNPGDEVKVDGQVLTFQSATIGGEYAQVHFAGIGQPMLMDADTLFFLAN